MSEPCANVGSKGCKGRATDQGVDLSLARSQEPRLYCRGCGGSLPLGFRGQFHKECLRADKRRRTREQRRREQERFRAWLQKQLCPECGVRYGEVGSDRPAGVSCETSQSTQERDLPKNCGTSTGRRLERPVTAVRRNKKVEIGTAVSATEIPGVPFRRKR